MTGEPRLPARRELPPEVRARLRTTVMTGIARPVRRGRTVAAAAAVVLLVAGAAVGIQLFRSGPDEAPVAGTGNSSLDRCWTAAKTAGKSDLFPAPSKWKTVSTQAQGDDVVVAFTANDKPVFCELTATTVTLSDPGAKPGYASGTHTALLLYTGTGLAAGVVDPAWYGVELSLPDGLGIETTRGAGATHQFTMFTGTDPAKTQLWAGEWIDRQKTRPGPRAALPAPPAPLFSIVDRPGDRTSREGQALGTCLAGLPEPLADADGYQPGALLEDGAYQVVLGRIAGHTVACVAQPDARKPAGTSYQLYRDTFVGESIPARRLSVPGLGANGAKVPFVGIVAPSAASMIADFSLGTPVQVSVVNGTFACWIPAGAKPVWKDSTWVLVKDDKDAALFNGYVTMK
jgi:hypothetical protein